MGRDHEDMSQSMERGHVSGHGDTDDEQGECADEGE